MPKIAALGGMSSRGFGEFARQAAGAYIEDVFSTYLYNGTDAPQTITNGIDLSGNGGLVWLKSRSGTVVTGYDKHILFDTVRTNTNSLSTNSTAAVESGWSDAFFRFRADGFDFGTSTSTADQSYLNNLGVSYASWTFGKKQKFFDVVSYTGNGANRTISHNLGSVPGMIIIKRTNSTSNWAVYHRSLANTQYLAINTTAAATTDATYWNSTTPTATNFSLGTSTVVNASGGTYVAYLFAHDAGGFGADGSQNVISCGGFTADASGNATVNLGWEPQYVLLKVTSSAGQWIVLDTMRGLSQSPSKFLLCNSAQAEGTDTATYFSPTATGFVAVNGAFPASANVIYMAIRRGPMRTPTSGTSVFSPSLGLNATTADSQAFLAGFPVDMFVEKDRTSVSSVYPGNKSRLTGSDFLTTSSTAAAGTDAYRFFDNQTGIRTGISYNYSNEIFHAFARAPGFFDVVCYTGTGSTTARNHNLTVAPELIILKKRGTANGAVGTNWGVWANPVNPGSLFLNSNGALNAPAGSPYITMSSTTTTFTDSQAGQYWNQSGDLYFAYLFASLANVSKVGSYTGAGSTQTINCGFTGGARYVLIKRTDSTGDWWAWDTARGMVSGTDPRFAYNSATAEANANWVYTTTGGFQIVTSDATVNASGGSYIFLAIA